MAVQSIQNNSEEAGGYKPGLHLARRRFLRFMLRYPGWLMMRVAPALGLENIPAKGPAIVMINHIGWVDPLVALHTSPRLIVPLGKIEAFKWPVIGLLPRMWGAIPVDRNSVDSKALRMALEALKAGEIILVAPEGTRNEQLQSGTEGVAYLATRAAVPILPAVLEDTEGLPTAPFLKRWWGPRAKIKYGRPFRFPPEYRKARREDLRRLMDAAMYELAGMLPESRRGVYSDLSRAEEHLLERA
jgi:1-acyl-sn-glycerol-3-phosphate acyltransferase